MRTLTLEGDITAADTRTQLTGQGSVAAPSLITPADAKVITAIAVSCSSEALADGAQSFFLRIGGNAVKNGEQVIAVSAVGRVAVQSGSDAAPQLMTPLVLSDLDIEISSSDSLSISAEGAGTDTGTAHITATLIFA